MVDSQPMGLGIALVVTLILWCGMLFFRCKINLQAFCFILSFDFFRNDTCQQHNAHRSNGQESIGGSLYDIAVSDFVEEGISEADVSVPGKNSYLQCTSECLVSGAVCGLYAGCWIPVLP